MSLVVDSSVTVSWFAPDEDFRVTEDVLSQVAESGAFVPFHWRSEFANALLMSVRRGRAETDFPAKAFAEINALPITTDMESLKLVESAAMAIAMSHQLTVYDAIYLEVAIRRQLPLATLDRALANAARSQGVPVLGIAA